MKKLQRQKDEYRKWPNNLFQSLNRPGVYLGSGSNLGQAFNSIVVRLLQVKLLRWRKWFNQPALVANSASLLVTHGGVHLFRHHPDHFAGHSLMACPFADNPSQHVYLKLFLPPPGRCLSCVFLLPCQPIFYDYVICDIPIQNGFWVHPDFQQVLDNH